MSRRPRGHRRTTESFTGRSANRGARHEGVRGSRPGAMGRVTVLRFPVSRLRPDFGAWSDLRAKPHAGAPQCDGGRREDSDHERDQLPPRIISAVLRGNRYQTNRGGDAGTGCCHPLVIAVHNPAREHAQREDRQRSVCTTLGYRGSRAQGGRRSVRPQGRSISSFDSRPGHLLGQSHRAPRCAHRVRDQAAFRATRPAAPRRSPAGRVFGALSRRPLPAAASGRLCGEGGGEGGAATLAAEAIP